MSEKKPYLVCVAEHYAYNYVIWGEDESEACETANELVNDGAIDPTHDGSFGNYERYAETIRVCSDQDLKEHPVQYGLG